MPCRSTCFIAIHRYVTMKVSGDKGDIALKQGNKVVHLRTWNTLAIFLIALIWFLIISFRVAISLALSTAQGGEGEGEGAVHKLVHTQNYVQVTHHSHNTKLLRHPPSPHFLTLTTLPLSSPPQPHLQAPKSHHHHPHREYSTHSPTSLSPHGRDTDTQHASTRNGYSVTETVQITTT